ncbi:sugar phosphate isomerase/epimerase [Candidatus Poribacteria bacterium]|nr:sugar phosphate isomerase/epimerase [Candidatus Poribacteria bacterium]
MNLLSGDIIMKNIIACNLNSYGQFREGAYSHLAKIGLTNVEVAVPAPGDVDNLLVELKSHGLTATSVATGCDVQAETVVTDFQACLDAAAQIGVKVVFTSAHAGDYDRNIIYERLRQIGENAAPLGIKVCLETHLDLAHNADVALETMRGVNHPNICINFDTGNVYFYNHDVTAVGELRKIMGHVGAVHLKDTNGGYRTWHFPALGEGVVDFKGVFQILNDADFYGPCAMELEGIEGEDIDEAGVQARMEQSVAYLKSIGIMD